MPAMSIKANFIVYVQARKMKFNPRRLDDNEVA